MAKDKSPTSAPTCASCKCEIGQAAGKIPFFVDDHANVDGEKAKHEAFCPTCFVYVRAPREGGRWMQGYFIPIKCAGCGLTSVSIGQVSCMQCGSGSVIALPPAPGVV